VTADLWAAPVADGPVSALVPIPGSKSVTNRALVLAALADEPSVIRRPLSARDTLLMVEALHQTLGATIEVGEADDREVWRVVPGRGRGRAVVDCGLAGTVMRFVPPVTPLHDGVVTFDGDPRARERPMAVVIDALRALGAHIDDEGRGRLPFVIDADGRLSGGSVSVDASASSQFVSGLLLAGALYEKGITVHHQGNRIPSLPHIAMTVTMLRQQGVDVDDTEPSTWRIQPGAVRALDREVEPDLSNAAPFLAAALVTGGSVRVPGWPRSTHQPGDVLRDLLARMGAEITLDEGGLRVAGPGHGAIRGLDTDLHDVGELTPVLAALAALAKSPSHLRGIGHLRGHETDRLAALAAELSALGADVREHPDALEIRPSELTGGVFRTYADHRMAQAGTLLGLAVPGVQIENVATTAKTLPDFVTMWQAMLGRSTE
jgi:3-phosphoshikimate 1-carboxyvinyltransferase